MALSLKGFPPPNVLPNPYWHKRTSLSNRLRSHLCCTFLLVWWAAKIAVLLTSVPLQRFSSSHRLIAAQLRHVVRVTRARNKLVFVQPQVQVVYEMFLICCDPLFSSLRYLGWLHVERRRVPSDGRWSYIS